MCSHGDRQWRGKSKLQYRDQAMVEDILVLGDANAFLICDWIRFARAVSDSETAMDNGKHLEED